VNEVIPQLALLPPLFQATTAVLVSRMSSLLYTLRDRLADPAIPWRSVILAVVVSVEVWESWVA
jgi:hypothetical protein